MPSSEQMYHWTDQVNRLQRSLLDVTPEATTDNQLKLVKPEIELEIELIKERMMRLESQISRLLLLTGTAHKDEILITSEMPKKDERILA